MNSYLYFENFICTWTADRHFTLLWCQLDTVASKLHYAMKLNNLHIQKLITKPEYQWQACPPSQTRLKRSWVGFQKVKYYHKSRQLCSISIWPDMPGTSEYLWVTNRLYRSPNICFKWAATTCIFWDLVEII